MPDPELPDQLKARLAAALEHGVEPVAARPLQARYAGRPPAGFHVRAGVLAFAAGAVVMLIALGMVGNPAPRTWILHTIDSAVRQISTPASPSPAESGGQGSEVEPSSSPTARPAHESPEASSEPKGSPEASSEPRESPEASGEPRESGTAPSPSAEPSGDGGHEGTPSSSPSPQPSGE